MGENEAGGSNRNAERLVMLLLAYGILRKKAVDYLALGLEKKSAKIIVLLLVTVYVLSLMRQLVVYDDKVTIVFKWIYYLVFVAFCEELEYRDFWSKWKRQIRLFLTRQEP